VDRFVGFTAVLPYEHIVVQNDEPELGVFWGRGRGLSFVGLETIYATRQKAAGFLLPLFQSYSPEVATRWHQIPCVLL